MPAAATVSAAVEANDGACKKVLRALIIICVAAAVVTGQQPPQQSANAVPPSLATQPLYACLVHVSDLPEYDGTPTPEMQAAAIGIRQSLVGMLDQWFITNDFSYDPPYGATADRSGSSSSNGSSTGSSSSAAKETPVVKPRRRASKLPGRSMQPPSSSSSSSSSRSTRHMPRPTTPVAAPAEAGQPPANHYIIPRPAAMATGTTTAAAAAAAGQEGVENVLSVDPALAAEVAAAAAAAGGDTGQLLQSVEPSAAAAAAAAVAAATLQQQALQQPSNTEIGGFGNMSVPQQQQQQQQQQPMNTGPEVLAAAAAVDFSDLDSNQSLPTSPISRHLLQTADKKVCNLGTPTKTTVNTVAKRGFSAAYGEVGIAIAQTNVAPPDPTLAVGPFHAVHVVNSLIRIIPLTPNGMIRSNPPPGEARLIPLPDFFSLVASPCSGGYINPAAAYDKEIGRFLLTAICGGDTNQVVLAISTTNSATGAWILYAFAGELTQGSPMACDDYPVSFYSQVTYNKDGVYLTFVQNCPTNQDTATGAMLFAIPKWAAYKGATYFWVPVWTAWDIYTAVGVGNNDELYPGAFLQLQPVIPQRAEDVQAEVVYFVSDNLNYVFPLQRTAFTTAALINTGSLWLYEGPNTDSPAPLLVARVVGRGITALAVPDTKLVQPLQETGDEAPVLNQQCQGLDAGAMRTPGLWNGGAALYGNTIYIVDRGPDIKSEIGDLFGNAIFLPTVYWAALTPSFCVSGPCAPWFGSDWGWSDGWDWVTGTWAADSDRGKNGYTDPAFYNQVFLYPSGTTSSGQTNFGLGSVKGRRLQQQQQQPRSSGIDKDTVSSSGSSSSRTGKGDLVQRDAVGVPVTSSGSSGSSSGTGYKGSLTAAGIRAQLGPTASRQQFTAAVKAALDRMEQLQPTTVAIGPGKRPGRGGKSLPGAVGSQAVHNGSEVGMEGYSAELALPAIPVDLGQVSPGSAFEGSSFSSNSSSNASSRQAGIGSLGIGSVTRSVAAGRADGGSASKSSGGSGSGSSSSSGPAKFLQVTPTPVPSTGGGPQASVSNVFYGGQGGSSSFSGWTGWGYTNDYYYYDYYQFWREHYFLRNLYMNLRIPPKVNPCKFYKNWTDDNTITFGAIVSRRGVLDYVSKQQNPVGIAYPQVAVVGGTMLVVFSYSGPKGLPGDVDRFPDAYPGVGYTFIPPESNGSGNYELKIAKLTGYDYDPGCVRQYGVPFWGQYSGIDIHYPSQRVLSAVESGWSNRTDWVNSNAATWINVFS